MDPLTIVIALLTAMIAVLCVVVWLGHLDLVQVVNRMDRAIERMDRSATAAEHAADGREKLRLLRVRRPRPPTCRRMPASLWRKRSARWCSNSCATGRSRGPPGKS